MKDAANGVSLASEVTSGRVAVGRREFLRQSVLTAAGTIVAGEFRAQSESADTKSKVVIPHLPGAVGITNLKVYDTASGALTCEVQQGPTIPSQPVAY